MQPVDRIEPKDWMVAPATLSVLAALRAGGAEARFVGGCVRDALAGRAVQDIDIATPEQPERVLELLEAAGLKAVPTGLQHGTVTAVVEHHPFEITTLREDVETFGRHAKVAFTDDWEADAARRDFTFNALSLSPEGALYDPFGGRADLDAGRVRFVGDAHQRIREDYLRILRFFRFHAHYGRIEPDRATLQAIAGEVGGLKGLSGERLRSELLKLLEAPNPLPALTLMRGCGVLERVIPLCEDLKELGRLLALEHGKPDSLLRLAALLPAEEGRIRALGERLRLSNRELARLLNLLLPPVAFEPSSGSLILRRLCYALGKQEAIAALRLKAARRGDDPATLEKALAVACAWDSEIRFPLAGRDLLTLGAEPGERLGKVLKAVEDWWIAADFAPDKEACLAEAKRRLGLS